jgi:hypothetical protein
LPDLALRFAGYPEEMSCSHKATSGENFNARPRASELDPHRLPERTVLEARLHEISLGTFPVYSGTSAELAA